MCAKMSDNYYMSRKAIGAYLCIHPDAVRNLERQGRIPPPDLFISNRPRWRSDTIERVANIGVI